MLATVRWQSIHPSVLLVGFLLAPFVGFVVSGGGRRVAGHDEDASVVGLQHREPRRVVVVAGLVVQTPEQLRLQRAELLLQRRRPLVQAGLLIQQLVTFLPQLQQLHTQPRTDN